jgi:hypothetical protein
MIPFIQDLAGPEYLGEDRFKVGNMTLWGPAIPSPNPKTTVTRSAGVTGVTNVRDEISNSLLMHLSNDLNTYRLVGTCILLMEPHAVSSSRRPKSLVAASSCFPYDIIPPAPLIHGLHMKVSKEELLVGRMSPRQLPLRTCWQGMELVCSAIRDSFSSSCESSLAQRQTQIPLSAPTSAEESKSGLPIIVNAITSTHHAALQHLISCP